jgi:amidase
MELGLSNNRAIWVEELSLGGDGPRVGVKDCLDIAGHRTGCGSRAFADAEPAARHADVVAALIAAGCHIVGKANMHELAYGVTGINAYTGTPENPRYPGRVPGGSSSGSAAAVAAGLVDFAIGTDTGGSIRVPATCCGVAGLKPTFGRVSRVGAHPEPTTLDCIGPFARDVATIERAMEIIDPDFRPAPRLSSPLLGIVEVDADADVRAVLSEALARTGLETVRASLPSFADAFRAGITIMAAEMAPLFGHLCGTGVLGPDVDARISAATHLTAADVLSAELVRKKFTDEVDAALENVDALVLPAMPSVPPLIEEAGDAPRTLRMTSLVRPFNVSGHPVVSLPLTTAEGLPAGLQLVGRARQDARLCALAAVVEERLA